MKEFNEVSDWDKMLAVLGVILTIAILFVAVITTKFVYEGGGIWSAIGWVLGWISVGLLSTWLTKKLFD